MPQRAAVRAIAKRRDAYTLGAQLGGDARGRVLGQVAAPAAAQSAAAVEQQHEARRAAPRSLGRQHVVRRTQPDGHLGLGVGFR